MIRRVMKSAIITIAVIVLVVVLSFAMHPEDPYSYATFLMGCYIIGIMNASNMR